MRTLPLLANATELLVVPKSMPMILDEFVSTSFIVAITYAPRVAHEYSLAISGIFAMKFSPADDCFLGMILSRLRA